MLGEHLMTGAKFLASAALALMLAAPLRAQESKAVDSLRVDSGRLAAVPTAQPAGQGSSATAEPSPSATPLVPAQSAASEQLSSLDPADRPIAEKIRDLLATRSGGIFASKNERAAVETFYQNRNYAPFWLDKGIENARAKSVIARLRDAAADGLDRDDYKTTSVVATSLAATSLAANGQTSDALADAELKLTQTVLTYARHLQAGRFPYNRVRPKNIELPQAPPEPADILKRLSEAADAGQALEGFSPQNEHYQKLKAMLAVMRGKAVGASGGIPEGPVLTYSRRNVMQDPRVPAIRERLQVSGEASDLRYDAGVADAVSKFQRASELPATGNLDARTVGELNGPTHDRQIETIIANMERWRWYPRDLGKAHVLVNEPDFTLKVMNDGAKVWTTRVVIGKPSMQTPLLSETMKYATINPTSHVPQSIVHNEYLPALAQDPTVLSRMGLRVHYGRDGVSITMPPGDNNALGRIRFNFPNRFIVYQHDTPDKYMFAHDVRAESHGCMRVQDPAKYAEVLFNIARPDEHWTAEKVKSLFGSGEQDIQIQPTPIWVHLTYQTAFVDEAGKLQIRRDVYGLDSRTLTAIRHERAIIDSTPEGKHEQEVVASTSARRSHRHARSSFIQSMFYGGPSPGYSNPGYSSPSYAKPRPPRGIFYR
jgi:L,D-transpeptidase YcbB